ncbi:MAG: NAD-dependent epimerase/dehydratase family protein [Planctomycetota bacterium]|jgi:nucleoside-diphosphate-sugar epimerase|nr:NAD-dependent epimerase/dehydratase family protein [Planctomycetota bacterium]
MRTPVTLITGAGGEIGHGLIEHFKSLGREIVALDLKEVDESLQASCQASIVGNILDEELLQRLVTEYEIWEIYHLAALLSTRAEYAPVQAHRVNVEGTLNLLQLAHEQSRWHGHSVKFLFPSSIAAYGIPDRATKTTVGKVRETEYAFPSTIYGCNKLYCEQLGRYFTLHFQQLAAEQVTSGVDFRALRFPGLISAATVPSGGTSDYVPGMIHAAAQGEAYECFVDADARLPFMAMPDAIRALAMLADASADALTQRVYNITSFSVTAGEMREQVLGEFPEADITFVRDEPRGRIVDSWPGDVDDGAARSDWNWSPELGLDGALTDYVFPGVRSRYA